MSDIVSAGWLMQNLDNVRAVDASWYMPADKRDAKAEFEAAHIPGAVFYDIDMLSDRNTPLPHMLPDTKQFARQVLQLSHVARPVIERQSLGKMRGNERKARSRRRVPL